MVRYREFWFCLLLLALVLFHLLALQRIDAMGHYWVHVLHEQAKVRGVTDERIYYSKTHDSFVTFIAALIVPAAALVVEILLLLRRMRTGFKSKASYWVFGLALLPFIIMLGRTVYYLVKLRRPL